MTLLEVGLAAAHLWRMRTSSPRICFICPKMY